MFTHLILPLYTFFSVHDCCCKWGSIAAVGSVTQASVQWLQRLLATMVSIVVICNVSRLAKGEDATARVTAILRAGRGRWRQHPPSPPLTIVSTMLALLELSRSKCVCVLSMETEFGLVVPLVAHKLVWFVCIHIFKCIYMYRER